MRQLTSNSVRAGDLFYIPAVREAVCGFVMARYIELIPTNVGHLIEVFARFYLMPPAAVAEVDKSERLFRPIMCSLRFSEIPRWKVLFSDSGYEKSESDYNNIAFAFPNYIWKGGKEKIKPSYEGQLKEFEDSTCWRMIHVVFRVNAHLAGIFEANEAYDYRRLPEDLRVDNPVAKERVIVAARLMDERFKTWAEEAKTLGAHSPRSV